MKKLEIYRGYYNEFEMFFSAVKMINLYQ